MIYSIGQSMQLFLELFFAFQAQAREVYPHAQFGCDEGLGAFQATAYPFLKSRCIECHGNQGIGPGHSSSDPRLAYEIARGLTDFNHLEQSSMVTRVVEQHWREYDPEATGATRDEIITELMAWWEMGQKNCPSNEYWVTQEIEIPQNLPTDDFTTMRWDLGLFGAAFEGSIFEIEIQLFAGRTPEIQGAYRIERPRLATSRQALHVSGIRVLMNGIYRSLENTFETIDLVIAPRAFDPENQILPFPVLSAMNLIVAQDLDSGDRISISFDRLEWTESKTCSNPAGFDRLVYSSFIQPGRQLKSCVSCHGSASADPAAFTRFPISGARSELCASVLERVTPEVPDLSPLIRYGLSGVHGHPVIFASPEGYMESWKTWIVSESQN